MATITKSHLFLTFLGLPPDKTEPPLCGTVLSADWRATPGAPTCSRCLAAAKRRGLTVG